MKNLFISLILSGSLILSCSKNDSEYQASGSPTVEIKGFEVRDDNGYSLADIGNADIKNHTSETSAPYQLFMISFPNPARDVTEMIFSTRQVNVVARIWIVPATFQDPGKGMTTFSGMTMIAPAERPLLDTTIFMTSNQHAIQIRNLPEGFYRVYLKSQGILLWDNIVFSNTFQYH